MKAYLGEGKKASEIPAEYMDEAETAHMELVEAAAEGEDALMEKFFEVGELTSEEIFQGLKSGVWQGNFVPVFASAATSQIGVLPLLDAILGLMPSPIEAGPYPAKDKDGKDIEITASDSGPLAAYVWKTTADPFVGKQTYFRVYSGVVNSDSRIWNHDKGVEERFGSVNIPMGKETITVKTIHAGDIAVVPKLSETVTGNTLGDKSTPIFLPNTRMLFSGWLLHQKLRRIPQKLVPY
jgi:elongation factor G